MNREDMKVAWGLLQDERYSRILRCEVRLRWTWPKNESEQYLEQLV